ncbi:MAG: glutamyl-tRNA reductase [Omnitrophica bacterium]|nr:glutamyl-tRNA reductase [Candidatus Omnitrophota bacterium]
MGLMVIGISHKTAPVEIRERFSFTKNQLLESQGQLNGSRGIRKIIILSTCNRMEIYAHSACNEICIDRITEFLAKKFNGFGSDTLKYFYTLIDEEATRHIFRVASGLDSQVLGETEILGQVRSAWLISRESGKTDDFLDTVFEKAIEIGAAVRRNTRISQGNVSIGSVAVKMLKDQFGSLQDKAVLIVGAGKIAGLMSKYLKKDGIKGFFVSNRTYVKACELARECRGEAVHFNKLQEKLKTVDIVISSTASPHIILKKEVIEEAMNMRQKPLLLLDAAVPRDIDPEVRNVANVVLYDLDDLKYVIEKNYNDRKKEALRVEEIIEKDLQASYANV